MRYTSGSVRGNLTDFGLMLIFLVVGLSIGAVAVRDAPVLAGSYFILKLAAACFIAVVIFGLLFLLLYALVEIFTYNPELKRRIACAKECAQSDTGLLSDPIENDINVKNLVKAAQVRAEAEIGSTVYIGRCHKVWTRMKEILKNEHGINWYSPKEMNPNVKFD